MPLYDSLSFATGILGVFIAVPLLYLSKNRLANLHLGSFLIAFSLLCFASTSIYYTNSSILGLLDWSISLLGPLLYLYVRELRGYHFSRRQWLHGLPFILFLLILPILRSSQSPHAFTYFVLFFQCIIALYALAILFNLHSFKSDLHNNFSSTRERDLRWVSYLTITMIILLVIWIPAFLFGSWWGWAFAVTRILVLFFIGWYGLRQQMIFAQDAVLVPSEKYERSGMNEQIKSQITESLHRSMLEDKDYLINDLTLTQVAKKIETSSQLMSEYFNQVEGKSFFQYINELRVKEAMRLIVEEQNLPITEISFKAGFNSKSTFNAYFKKIAGVSPTQWRKRQCKST